MRAPPGRRAQPGSWYANALFPSAPPTLAAPPPVPAKTISAHRLSIVWRTRILRPPSDSFPTQIFAPNYRKIFSAGGNVPLCLGDGSKTCEEPSNFRINSRDHNRDTLILQLERLLVFPVSFGERNVVHSPLEDGKTARIILKREFVIANVPSV